MRKKYELVGEKKIHIDGAIVHRIRALIDFDCVKAGDLGGWVQSETNLSHEGTAWIANEAVVSGSAAVVDNARVEDCAIVYGRAIVRGCAIVQGEALVRGDAIIQDYARVCDHVFVGDYANICSGTILNDSAKVRGNARIDGNITIYGNVHLDGKARIHCYKDVLCVGPIGSRDDYTTFYRTEGGSIGVTCGCFYGSLADFLTAVQKTHGNNQYGKTYRMAAELAKEQMSLR